VRKLQIVDVTNYPVPTTATEINLLDSLSCSVIAIDDAMRIRYLNSSAEQLLGISARKVLH
jgi:nitrogen-specific signal transduction histidine kinase